MRLPGQQHMPGVMIVVVPLGAVFSARDRFNRIEQFCVVFFVFDHEMDMALRRCSQGSDGRAELAQHCEPTGLNESMHGIKP